MQNKSDVIDVIIQTHNHYQQAALDKCKGIFDAS